MKAFLYCFLLSFLAVGTLGCDDDDGMWVLT